MKILITGGAGFIGSNLALKLLERGHEITVLDSLSEQIHGSSPGSTSPLYRSIKDKLTFYQGDVCIKNDWEKALTGIEVIVHFAAETGTGQSMYEISRYTNTNVGGTALLLDILANKKSQVKKVIVASSRSIYGEGKYMSKELGVVYPEGRKYEDMARGEFEVTYGGNKSPLELVATDEDSKIHPSSVYGITKQNQEQMVMCVCQSLDIACVALRYQNVYGAGQSLQNPYTGILSIFSTLIKNHSGINVFEDGKESRDFIYIDDVVEATILSIEKEEARDQIFNVGTGVPVNVLDVATLLCKKYQIEVPVRISGNFRVGDIRHNYADITKIKSLLGFSPQVSFESGIELFVNWVNSQQIAESKYEESYQEMKNKGLLK